MIDNLFILSYYALFFSGVFFVAIAGYTVMMKIAYPHKSIRDIIKEL